MPRNEIHLLPRPFQGVPKQPAHVHSVSTQGGGQGKSGYSDLSKVERALQGCGHWGPPPVILTTMPRTLDHPPTPRACPELSLWGLVPLGPHTRLFFPTREPWFFMFLFKTKIKCFYSYFLIEVRCARSGTHLHCSEDLMSAGGPLRPRATQTHRHHPAP